VKTLRPATLTEARARARGLPQSYLCAETKPEPSLRTGGRCVEHARTWDKSKLSLINQKTRHTDFLFISPVRTVTPRYRPLSITDTVTDSFSLQSRSRVAVQSWPVLCSLVAPRPPCKQSALGPGPAVVAPSAAPAAQRRLFAAR
jgi:hypothetical protein